MIRRKKLPDQHESQFLSTKYNFLEFKTQPLSFKFKNCSAKFKEFLSKLKKFSAKLKVSENPVTFVAAKWLKKQGWHKSTQIFNQIEDQDLICLGGVGPAMFSGVVFHSVMYHLKRICWFGSYSLMSYIEIPLGGQ